MLYCVQSIAYKAKKNTKAILKLPEKVVEWIFEEPYHTKESSVLI